MDVRDQEIRALLWSFAYFFSLLCGYYVLRPVRDEMGVAAGVETLQWLFTATFVAMILAVPCFGFVVARWPRRRFVPAIYRFFIVCLVAFFVVFGLDVGRPWVARAFFVWVSLFNLFVVSVFWSFMADLFRSEQGKRLFGFIAAGGTAGALVGPALTAALAVPLGPVNLLLVSALFLEGSVRCIRRLLRLTGRAPDGGGRGPAIGTTVPGTTAIGGGVLAGMTEALRSPYLVGICFYFLLFTATSTFLYFQQAHIVAGAFGEPAQRTRVFALIDLSVGVLTLVVQLGLTGRLIGRFGVGRTLAFLPLLTAAGFAALAWAPGLAMVIAFQATRRAANFAVSRPAREILFTVVTAEQKYKSKNFIDTVVYRGGDAASGWLFAGLRGLGLDLAQLAALAVPLALLWAVLALRLGRRQDRLALRSAGAGVT